MTLTAPIPVRHAPIRIEGRIYPHLATAPGQTELLLAAMRGRIEIGVMRALQPTPWSIIDGDIGWELGPEDGKPYIVLTGTWVQRVRG